MTKLTERQRIALDRHAEGTGGGNAPTDAVLERHGLIERVDGLGLKITRAGLAMVDDPEGKLRYAVLSNVQIAEARLGDADVNLQRALHDLALSNDPVCDPSRIEALRADLEALRGRIVDLVDEVDPEDWRIVGWRSVDLDPED